MVLIISKTSIYRIVQHVFTNSCYLFPHIICYQAKNQSGRSHILIPPVSKHHNSEGNGDPNPKIE